MCCSLPFRVNFPLRSGALALASVWALWSVCALQGAWAEESAAPDTPASPTFNYAIGAIVGNGPDYADGDARKNSLRPAWAIEYGRFRLSTSRGSALAILPRATLVCLRAAPAPCRRSTRGREKGLWLESDKLPPTRCRAPWRCCAVP